MKVLRLPDTDLRNKRVLIREDLNVPVQSGVVTSDARIRAALPTIRYALDQNARVFILSHLGRPEEGKYDESLSLAPVAVRLSELLGKPVPLRKDWLDGVDCQLGIHNAELHDDAYAQCHLVGGENFLAFDREIPLAHVHQHNFNERTLAPKHALAVGNFVAAGFEYFPEHAVFVPEATVGVLDDDFDLFHAFLCLPKSIPRSGVDMEHDREQICIR